MAQEIAGGVSRISLEGETEQVFTIPKGVMVWPRGKGEKARGVVESIDGVDVVRVMGEDNQPLKEKKLFLWRLMERVVIYFNGVTRSLPVGEEVAAYAGQVKRVEVKV